MLEKSNVIATIAVSDMSKAKTFYENVLGLSVNDENDGGVMYSSGSSKLFVYNSSTAGTGQATCATWKVDDVAKSVDELKANGVTFEHYDFPGSTREGDVHIMGGMQAAWFKDPDGNILCVSN